jgi:hypothetical protein
MAKKCEMKVRSTAAQMHALAAVQREIESRDSASNRKYLREFTQAFRRYDAVLTSEQLNEKIATADVLLVGDYHALPASQRFAESLVERLSQARPVLLGVEAILSRDQQILDAWWRREIAEEELRRRLRFDREWGYEWFPFYELLITARECADGIFGLDCMPRDDLRRIRSRDRHAAAKVNEMRQRDPDAAIVVLFGESHLAPLHLPSTLKELMPEERVLTVLQNVDTLYWQTLEQGASAVSIGDDAVCVFNSSPLEKYESYRLCLERWNAATEDPPDFTPAVYNLILSLAKSLGFRLDSPRNGTQPKFLADSLPEVVCGLASAHPEAGTRVEDRACVYQPETNTFFVGEFNIERAAEEAARFLHFACRGMSPSCADGEAVEDALAHFGSRLLCPAVSADNETPSELGEALYRSYVERRVSNAALRRLFLTRLEDCDQAEMALSDLVRVSG